LFWIIIRREEKLPGVEWIAVGRKGRKWEERRLCGALYTQKSSWVLDCCRAKVWGIPPKYDRMFELSHSMGYAPFPVTLIVEQRSRF